MDNDQYCLNNLADNPENKAIIERLDKALKNGWNPAAIKGRKPKWKPWNISTGMPKEK